MFLFRVFFSLMILLSLPSIVLADHRTTNSVKSIKHKVHRLHKAGVPFEEIAVVWDFHGVFTEQANPTPDMTLNPDMTDVLQYLHKRNVPQLIATAWRNPSDVKQELFQLGLNQYFDIKNMNNDRIHLTKVHLGKKHVALEGYKEGRLVALRRRDDFEVYFPNKAFGLEWCYPGRKFKYILFTDDKKGNLDLYESNFKETVHHEEKAQLSLYHLDPSYQKHKTARKANKTHSRQVSGEYNVFLSESE